MHPSFFPKTHLTKFLTVLLLLVALTSCGAQNQPNATSTATPTTSSSSPTSDLSDSLSLNKTGVSIDEGGLHIEVPKGVECPAGLLSSGQPDNPDLPINVEPLPGNNLVLATDRLTYDSNELKQIQDYIGYVYDPGLYRMVPLPNTLRWVLGGPTDTTRKIISDPPTYAFDCSLHYQITNTGQDVLQVASVGVQLTASPRPNTYHYRLIDMCSIVGPGCPGIGGGPSSCSAYSATIKLDANSGNSVFSAPLAGYGTSCHELTLNPKDTADLIVYIYSPQSMIYSVVPQLTLDTSSGPNTLTLTDLSSTLAFASNSQFSCYGLQGDTLVVESPSSEYAVCM